MPILLYLALVISIGCIIYGLSGRAELKLYFSIYAVLWVLVLVWAATGGRVR